jgi:hypothetical protein
MLEQINRCSQLLDNQARKYISDPPETGSTGHGLIVKGETLLEISDLEYHAQAQFSNTIPVGFDEPDDLVPDLWFELVDIQHAVCDDLLYA